MDISPKQLEMLIATVSQKSGIPKERLVAELRKGTFDSLMSTLEDTDKKKLTNTLSNPTTIAKMLNTPQAKELMKKIFG